MISGVVSFLNSLNVKESIKDFNGGTTFALGIILLCDEAHHAILYLKKKEIKKWTDESLSFGRGIEIIAKVSIVISMFASRPSTHLCGWVASIVFTEEQLTSFFGPNLNYSQNPYHVRHMSNLASFILGLPATLLILHKAYLYSKGILKSENIKKYHYLSKTQIQMIAGWNTVSHRTTIHALNALARVLIRNLK